MQELSVLLTLAAVFAIALVSPGPDVALVVRTSLHQGRRAGLASALGLACGILLHTTLVLTGVSLLLSRTPVLFAILQALGALYLAWLGVGALRGWLRRGDGQPGRLDGALPPSPLGPWLRGVATNLFNPKALVFFIALLGSLIPAQMSLGGKLAVAALLFGMGACWFGLLSLTLTR
ncbi:LysE family translocator, partial [Pseudomonas aeruginosa]